MYRMLNNVYPRRYYKNIYLMENNYKAAILALNSLQNNKADPQVQHPTNVFSKINIFLLKCGIKIQDLENKLSVIHVSGTKGKGSTCAFCESILRHHGYRTGFFSSPHLISVRERIKINGQPVSKQEFSNYFWEIYGKLQQNKKMEQNDAVMPTYFMFLTLMAFKIFLEKELDVVILEVGIGGEYDFTNILSNTAVVGISSLGYDHVTLLGNTIEEIAWQKAGIMKTGAIAITASNQPIAAFKVLQKRALEKKCALFVAPELNEYQHNEEIKLSVEAPVQLVNASLAIQLANAWMNPHNYPNESGFAGKSPIFTLHKEILQGLSNCHWPGRTQILRHSSSLVYCLDGAHNRESMQHCTSWFLQTYSSTLSKKVLIFNMTGNRDVTDIMRILIPCQFDFALFCTNRIEKVVDPSSDNWSLSFENEEALARTQFNYKLWTELNPFIDENDVKIFSSVIEAHEYTKNLSLVNQLHVLVTGSLHLVGAFLKILNPELEHV